MRLSRWLNLIADHSGDALFVVYAVVVVAAVVLVAVLVVASLV